MTDEILEYELIDIEFELNYEDVITPSLRVGEDGAMKDGQSEPQYEYDEQGIPKGTSKDEIKIRQKMIFAFYDNWKANNPNKSVYNQSLKDHILIRNESVVEAASHASKRYFSTLAVMRLDDLLANAKKVDVDKPKPGNKNQQKLVQMILMSRRYDDIGTIKLTIGVRRRSGDKIQYGITALEEDEKIIPVSKVKTNKAPHKK